MSAKIPWPILLISTALPSVVSGSLAVDSGSSHPRTDKYLYGGPAFLSFVGESYRVRGGGTAKTFLDWFAGAVQKSEGRSLSAWLAGQAHSLRIAKNRDEAVRLFAVAVHKLIKEAIPHFSLDRGFEFAYTAKFGERQCLLQSVLIAGLAQKVGIRAGAAMVWSNEQGQQSNLGHVTALFQLPNGHLVMVDASESHPFAVHQGLFLSVGKSGYRFLVPNFAESGDEILSFETPSKALISVHTAKFLDTAFLKSQFDFYRAEREPGGLLDENPTPQGLARSAAFMEKAVGECPQNPLAVYSLGRVFARMGRTAQATTQFERGYVQYSNDGLIPDGPRAAAGK